MDQEFWLPKAVDGSFLIESQNKIAKCEYVYVLPRLAERVSWTGKFWTAWL